MKATRKEDIRPLDKLNELRKGNVVVLSTRDQDLCNVPRCDALIEARKIADELHQIITVRDPITDWVYKTVKV